MAKQTLDGFYQAPSSELLRDNSIFALGENIKEIDTGNRKLGDGVTPYKDLPYVGVGSADAPEAVAITENFEVADNTIHSNNGASDYVGTVPTGLTQGGVLQQNSTGKVSAVAGSGVTFIPTGTVQTSKVGDQIVITPTSTADTYQVDLAGDEDEAPVTGFTSRALTNADNGKTIVPTNGSQTITVDGGLKSGFQAFVNNNATVDGAATIVDKRVSGAANPTFAIVNTGVDVYDLIGGKS